jgi:hypothetical protein
VTLSPSRVQGTHQLGAPLSATSSFERAWRPPSAPASSPSLCVPGLSPILCVPSKCCDLCAQPRSAHAGLGPGDASRQGGRTLSQRLAPTARRRRSRGPGIAMGGKVMVLQAAPFARGFRYKAAEGVLE